MTTFSEVMLWHESQAHLHGMAVKKQQETHRLLTHRAKGLLYKQLMSPWAWGGCLFLIYFSFI